MGYMNYEERLEVAKRLYELSNAEQKTALECIFPELCESEDEKIRREIMEYITLYKDSLDDDEYKSWIAWLEKQGEKKSSDEVLKIRQELYQSGYNDGYKHGCEDTKKQGEQKSTDEDMKEALRTEYEKGRADAFAQMQQGWSDKEKQMYADIIEATKKSGVFKEAYKRELVDFLNSLKERYTCKPSDEQMRALEYIINNAHNTSYSCKIAKELLEQLRKLKGEEV